MNAQIPLKIGVLALQGDVQEHISCLHAAAAILNTAISVVEVRTATDCRDIKGLIIPGGESTTLSILCKREELFEPIQKVKVIFGTCAGAILLAKKVTGSAVGQRTLALMDITVQRNAYGRQRESFEEKIKTKLGEDIGGVFIRAPKITEVGKTVTILATHKDDILAVEQRVGPQTFIAACFHPELSTTIFHEHFITCAERESSE